MYPDEFDRYDDMDHWGCSGGMDLAEESFRALVGEERGICQSPGCCRGPTPKHLPKQKQAP